MFQQSIITFLESKQFVSQSDVPEYYVHLQSHTEVLILASDCMQGHTEESWETWISKFNSCLQIWEDSYLANPIRLEQLIIARINKSKSVFGRDTRIVSISAEAARAFMDANHVLGFSKGQTYLGCIVPPHRLFRGIQSEFEWEGSPLMAVAIFGKPMVMKELGWEGLLSGELIKLATLPSIRLIGGITKFLQAYSLIEPVHHVMTYIDLAWNSGKGFLACGFKIVSKTGLLYFKCTAGKRSFVSEFKEADASSPGNLKLRFIYEN